MKDKKEAIPTKEAAPKKKATPTKKASPTTKKAAPTKKASPKKDTDNDTRRFSYMIAWRDRYITALQEQLAGAEETERLLCSLLHYALTALAGADGNAEAFEVNIPQSKITQALDAWECRTERLEDSYCVRFEKRSQASAPDLAGDHANGGEEAKN